MNILDRAIEIAKFLHCSVEDARKRLENGFHYNHALVAQDFLSKNVNVNNSESLLNWYRTTDAYIWELSAYHAEEAFNYDGMCRGIAEHLSNANATRVLCLGDGIGDLSLECDRYGLDAYYHDLQGSRTAAFAMQRFENELAEIETVLTSDFNPPVTNCRFDAVVALDFFEHLVNVEEWVQSVHSMLDEGGVFLAQNAFACGDEMHGNSIPMHLSVNNKFVEGWDPLLESVGFTSMHNGWWQKNAN